MLELRTLGTIDLMGEDGRRIDSVVHHAKRASLLVHLCASHPPRLHRRAKLLALLWPELDEAHARSALRHELYELRRVLGAGVLIGDGSETIGVDAERIWCDARAFEAALEAGHPEEAVGLYHGEFVPGLYVDGAEFEHSIEEARERFSRRAAEAARALASAAEARADLEAAVRWTRRETELAPYDESGWRHLICLLDQLGDRGGALRAYDALAASLRNELETEPSPETKALVERIRHRSEALGTASGNGQPAEAHRFEAIPVSAAGDGGDAANAEALHSFLAATSRKLQPTSTVIKLMPVENQTGDPEFDAVSRRVRERLAQALVEPTFIKLVAGGNGDTAAAVISATVFRRVDRIAVRTSLAEADGGRILEISPAVTVTREALDDSLDAIAAHALTAVATHYDPHVAEPGDRAPPFKMRSWKAYLEYLQGSELFGSRQFQEAARRLVNAYEMDRSFVKAAIFGTIALAYAGQPERAESLVIEATAGRVLTDYERLFGAWIHADIRGRRPEAYRAAKEITRITPHPLFAGIAAWEAINIGRLREAVQFAGSMQHLGHGWWRNWTRVWESLGGALHVLGDHQGEFALIRNARARFPEALDILRAEVRARAAIGEPDRVLDLLGEALTRPPTQALMFPFGQMTPASVAWTAAQELDVHGHTDAAKQARVVAIEWSSERADSTPADKLLEARLRIESGDADGASLILRAMQSCEDPEFLGVVGLMCTAKGDAAGARMAITQLEGLNSRYLSGRHLLHAAEIRAALGDGANAMKTLQRAFAAGLPYDVELHALPALRSLAERRDFKELLRPHG